ncbi:HD domain-containing protein [Actinomadura flavalba]|uniref:HD domain-containing protein n=1 Tax=Actinomadura flavalba TaxID=1120938 RepID=UPI000381500F|nr:HD domain-containing protein [Actinomadura flavalba]
MRVPGDDEIRRLHERCAPTPEAFALVYAHCAIVCAVAEQLMARRDDVDAALVRAGCLLHDLGVYRLFTASGELDHARYIRHGVLGHEMLAELGFAETLCRFCSRHTGVGLTAADVRDQGLPLPPGDYLAETPEERLVMYADKFHTKTRPPAFVAPETAAASLHRFGPAKVAAFTALRADFGDPDLPALQAHYGHALV